MSSVLRPSVAFVICLFLAAGCTGEPEIVEALPGTEQAVMTTEDLVEETTTTADLLTTAPSTTARSTTVAPTIVLEDEAAVDIGSAFVAARCSRFVNDLVDN